MSTARLGPVPQPPKMQLGDLTIKLLDGGELWLDGGAMFGVIPKPVWSKLVEVDESNRIPLAMTCALVETGGKRILIETGAGEPLGYGERERGFFRFRDHWVLDSLEAAGVERGSIDYVILTHLHFDHAGGVTMADGHGGHVPTFPNARYIVQRGEWEDAVNGHAVMRTTYRTENLAPLEEADVLSLADGRAEIVPGISVTPMPGHTRYHQGVVIESGEQRIVQPGDLLPTAAHVGTRYNMGYDLLQHENMEQKGRLLETACEAGSLLLLGQDPTDAIRRIEKGSRGFSLASAL
ncbi:MAG: MBL fold metallo-hydrolase [Planctomycetota bacterium]